MVINYERQKSNTHTYNFMRNILNVCHINPKIICYSFWKVQGCLEKKSSYVGQQQIHKFTRNYLPSHKILDTILILFNLNFFFCKLKI